MFDLLDDEALTYTDIYINIMEIRQEVETLDDDSLIEEVSAIQHNILGKESEKIQHLVFKNYNDGDFDEEDRLFLKSVYCTYYSQYAILVDDGEDNE